MLKSFDFCFVFSSIFFVFRLAAGFYLEDCNLLELSWPFNNETVYWPNAPSFKIEPMHKGQTSAGFFYFANKFSAAEHGGTHLDAPSHFSAGKQDTDKVLIRYKGLGGAERGEGRREWFNGTIENSDKNFENLADPVVAIDGRSLCR